MDINNNTPAALLEQEEVTQDPVDIAAEMEVLYATLREYLQIEHKFQPKLLLPQRPQHGEITSGARDGAAHVLRCLKVWYDLPSDVLFHAVNLLDRFLTKMKVRPCHMSCISVSCINIAILSHQPLLPEINTEDLVSISQSKCTVGDVRRMSAIVKDKLGMSENVDGPLTSLQWLRLFCRLMRWAAHSLQVTDIYNSIVKESELVNKLEILLCDWSCVNVRACELALVLLCTDLDARLVALQRSAASAASEACEARLPAVLRLVDFALELQRVCRIPDADLYASHAAVVQVLERYEARSKMPHRQRLVWRVSSRTLRQLRPLDRLRSRLPTIAEQQQTPGSSGPRSPHRPPRRHSDSDSGDDHDWPTSPTLPIYIT